MLKKFLLLFCLLLPTYSFAGKIALEVDDFNLAGHKTIVTIVADSLDSEIGGFRFVLALDETKYSFLSLNQGAYLDSCDWEYFTWQKHYDENLSYSIAPATALLEINGLASLNGGAPTCAISLSRKELVHMDFLIAIEDDWNHIECNSLMIPFYWRDCYDNLIFSQNIDTSYTVGEYYFSNNYDAELVPISSSFPGYGINGANCDTVSLSTTINNLSLINSELDFPCVDSIDGYRGDLNFNGKRYEVSDCILYYNYFIYGISVFTVNVDGQIAASDINSDGITLSMRDIVYCIRVVLGNAISYPKNSFIPYSHTSLVASNNNYELSLNSTNRLDAVYLKIVSSDKKILTTDDFTYLAESIELGYVGDTTTLLMVNFDGSPVLESGANKLFESVNSNYRVTHFEAVDIYGQTSYNHKLAELPESFELFQNYPNPFNPTTVIKANLPKQTKYSLEILSITGQIVRLFEGSAQGLLEIEWDGKDAMGNSSASGIYLYHMKANGISASKKMLLLK